MAQTDMQEVTIGGETYRFRMLDPLTASDMLVDLSKVFGPVIAEIGGGLLGDNAKDGIKGLLEGAGEGGKDVELGSGITRGILELFDRLEKAKLREIINTLAGDCEVKQGENWPELEGLITVHFRGRVGLLYQWLFAALKVQFADFFDSMGIAMKDAVPRMVRGS
jgi:hypothetical protein